MKVVVVVNVYDAAQLGFYLTAKKNVIFLALVDCSCQIAPHWDEPSGSENTGKNASQRCPSGLKTSRPANRGLPGRSLKNSLHPDNSASRAGQAPI